MQAYMEETGEQIDGRIILRFDKETWQFDVHPLEDYEWDVKAFNAALILRKRQQLLSKKK
jgi:ribosomal protein L16 Arg81 hydroxylase